MPSEKEIEEALLISTDPPMVGLNTDKWALRVLADAYLSMKAERDMYKENAIYWKRMYNEVLSLAQKAMDIS